ncbi:hypothetical protein PR202_gb16557 [Eleusine coracana subsp. coracana]|uniref:Jacalin-type lectin domain-containing protein n=1 Tax=Eleusine coracana subsp. coracana TaxID=191504 RepID=A0AAV5EYF6_ELECO|nr:hypothetical protein PR202_gb16557 [Eleusine coracana subsp. coracana]
MARLSGAAVLLILVVPLFMYTFALFVGIQLGRAVERNPDSVNVVSVKGVVQFFAEPRGVASVGPWGGSGGQPFYMRDQSAPLLRSITLYYSSVIHSLACEYSLAGDGSLNRMAGPWGLPHSFGSRAVRAMIELSAGEHVTAMEGTMAHFGSVPDVVITSLTFRTSAGRMYGPYGSESGARFSIPAAGHYCIVGFWGRSGWLLDSIGVYMKPSCTSKRTNKQYPPPYVVRDRSSNVY